MMMSERKHVSDAAEHAIRADAGNLRIAEHQLAIASDWCRNRGLVLLASAEHEELLRVAYHVSEAQKHAIAMGQSALDLQVENDKLKTEVVRLALLVTKVDERAIAAEQRLRGITFHADDAGDLIRIDERDENQQVVRVMWEKRARKNDGVIHVEPFPEVQPDTSAPFPPAHRARMLA